MFTFSHAGRMGDVLYGLYWATRISRPDRFRLILRTGVSAWDPSGRPHMMEPDDAAFLRPLLEAQPYLESVSVIGRGEKLPPECVELDSFRRNMSSVIGKEIRSWYYPRGPLPPGEFDRPVLNVPPVQEHFDRLAVCFTPRYREAFDVSAALMPYRNSILFVGLPEEHAAFCRSHFEVEYFRTENALELLRVMASCRAFVGNVSGTFAIAECAKVRRVLCLAPDRGNVRVCGSGAEASNAAQLQTELKTIMEKQT